MNASPSSACSSTARPAFEADAEVPDHASLELERVGRAHRAVDPPRVGRGEDLLGRHVHDGFDPGGGDVERGEPGRVGMEADLELGARPAVAERVEAVGVERGATRRPSEARWSFPAATGSGSSSRTAAVTACQRRSTSGSPKTVLAHPSFGYATIDQLTRPSVRRSEASVNVRSREAAIRAPSRSAKSSGSGFPVIASSAAAVGAELVEALNEPRRATSRAASSGDAPRSASGARAGRHRGRRRSAAPAPRRPPWRSARGKRRMLDQGVHGEALSRLGR